MYKRQTTDYVSITIFLLLYGSFRKEYFLLQLRATTTITTTTTTITTVSYTHLVQEQCVFPRWRGETGTRNLKEETSEWNYDIYAGRRYVTWSWSVINVFSPRITITRYCTGVIHYCSRRVFVCARAKQWIIVVCHLLKWIAFILGSRSRARTHTYLHHRESPITYSEHVMLLHSHSNYNR